VRLVELVELVGLVIGGARGAGGAGGACGLVGLAGLLELAGQVERAGLSTGGWWWWGWQLELLKPAGGWRWRRRMWLGEADDPDGPRGQRALSLALQSVVGVDEWWAGLAMAGAGCSERL
jgi:hypothetical protein